MKQMTGSYQMIDFPVPPGLSAVNVDGGFFGHGERYYLTPEQRRLLDESPSLPTAANNHGKSLLDHFLDIFR